VNDLAEQLRALVGDAFSQRAEIADLQQLTGGASRETWSFDALLEGGERWPLILRRHPLGAQWDRAMSREAHAIEAAARAGVPEPRIFASSDDPAALGGAFILMERIEGETIARRILRDDAFAAVRPRLAEQCGELLARIHSIPAEEIPGLEAFDVLADLRETLDSYEDWSPTLELGLRQLERRRPEPTAEVVVHGDFRNGNLIVGPDGIRAVLDWELAHLGDPMQDLGWLCVRCWRFGGPGPVGGFGSYADLFRGYERTSGQAVDRDAVHWWELFGTVWWGIGCMRMGWRYLSGAEQSVELAAIGRRVWEQEYDVMLLLGGS
jgi:aminoglycoside phosphotransferase (APT) family kinase protein